MRRADATPRAAHEPVAASQRPPADPRTAGTPVVTTVRGFTPVRNRISASGRSLPLGLTAISSLIAALALLPIGYLLVRAQKAGIDRLIEILWRERTLALVLRSLGLTAAVVALSLLIGVGLAWLVVRSDFPGRRVIGTLAALPLAVPSYVAALAWISALPRTAGFAGAVGVLTLCSYPYVFLPVAAALRRTDAGLEEVARSLGRSPRQVFARVTLPRIWPAAAAGGLLVALYALSDFGAVSIMRFDAFTRVIHTSYQASFDRTPAAVLGLVLVVITVVISAGEARLRRRDLGAARVGGGVPRIAEPARLGGWRWPLGAMAYAVLAAALAFPLASLGYWFLIGLSGDLDWARLGASVTGTAWFALLGALACTVAALPVGILAARHRGRFVSVVEQSTYAAHALPGLVIALALVFFGVRVVPWAYQQTPMLVFAYFVLFLPLAVGGVRAAVQQSPVRTEEVARSLGAGPVEVLRRVTLPLAAPGVAASAALVMLTCMKELPATLLLRPTGVDTLATMLWSKAGVAAYGAAAPYGLALVLLAVLPTYALMRIGATHDSKESRRDD